MAEVVEEYAVKTRGLGLPDYAAAVGGVPVGPVYTSTDIAELAARLGSPVTFDRRGNVVWFDDFESNINKWSIRFSGNGPGDTPLGVGGGAVLSADAVYRGSLAAKLTTPDAVGDGVNLDLFLPVATITNLGAEVSFTLDDDVWWYQITIIRRNGTVGLGGAIRYSLPGQVLTYWNSAGGRTDLIAPLDLGVAPEGSHQWHTLKMVADMTNGKYLRCIIDDQSIDMVADMLVMPYISSPSTFVSVNSSNGAVGNHSNFVDNVIVTQNELANVEE